MESVFAAISIVWMASSLGTPIIASVYVNKLGHSVNLEVLENKNIYEIELKTNILKPIEKETLFESCLGQSVDFMMVTLLGPISIPLSLGYIGFSTFAYIYHRKNKFNKNKIMPNY